MEIILDFRNPPLQVIVKEVLQLTSKLDTGGATADHNHVQEPLDLLWGLVFEHGSFDTVHDALANLLSIADLLQEA